MNTLHDKNSSGRLFLATYLTFEILPALIMALFSKYSDSYIYTIASVTLVQLLMLSAIFVYKKVTRTNVTEGMNLKKFPKPLPLLLLIVASIVSIYAGNNISTLFVAFLSKTGMKISLIEPRMDCALNIILSVICIAALPAFSEELFIRQGVLSGLKRNFAPYKAILLSAMIFSLMHTNAAQTLHQFFLGITLATLVTLSGSLWSGIIFHFANNLYVLIMCLIKPSAVKTDLSSVDLSATAWIKAIAFFLIGYTVIAGIIILFASIVHKKKSVSLDVESSDNNPEKSGFFGTRVGIFIDGGLTEIRTLFRPCEPVEQPKGNGFAWALVILVAVWTLTFVTGYIQN